MPIHDTGKDLICNALTKHISDIWQNVVYSVLDENRLAKLENKTLAIKVINRIIAASHDVLRAGVTERRKVPGTTHEIEMSDDDLAKEFEE